MHLFELDRLLAQIAKDCLNSLSASPSPVSNTSIVSVQIDDPQRQQNRSVLSNSSSSDKSTKPLRRSIECLYMIPTVNKQQSPLTPNCRSTLNIDRRPKSASNILLASQYPVSPDTHRYQRSNNRNFHTRMHRSENNLIVAIQRNQQEIRINSNNDDTLYENENVQELTKKFQQKPNSLSDYSRIKSRTIETRIINNDKQVKDDDELSWPQEPLSTVSSTQTRGIKKFVRNSLKLFIIQPQSQHKRTGK